MLFELYLFKNYLPKRADLGIESPYNEAKTSGLVRAVNFLPAIPGMFP
jgi:hypothetical protein